LGSDRLIRAKRRLWLLAFHVAAPYAFMSVYNVIRARLQRYKEERSLYGGSENWKDRLSSLTLPPFTALVDDQLRPINLALFFLVGKYYSMAKRAVRVKYVSRSLTRCEVLSGMGAR
jgi:hypothetical protein